MPPAMLPPYTTLFADAAQGLPEPIITRAQLALRHGGLGLRSVAGLCERIPFLCCSNVTDPCRTSGALKFLPKRVTCRRMKE